MFDGFKSEHITLSSVAWLENSALFFEVPFVPRTGEILEQRQASKYRGLTFTLVASKRHVEGMLPVLSGSLHKYHNHGEHNANDFGLADVREVLENLSSEFGIDPPAAKLRTLEIGLNLLLPAHIPVAHVLASVVAYGPKQFTDLKLTRNRQKYGKVCARSDYQIKVYDKGKQQGWKRRDLLRVEVKVLKMRKLERFGIATLADLTDPAKVAPLGEWLAGFVADLVFIEPGSIDESQLTERELLDLERWMNPTRWEGWKPQQRKRQKTRLSAFFDKYAKSNLQNKLCQAIIETWEYLTYRKQKKGICFHQVPDGPEAEEMYMFSPLVWMVKTYPQGGNSYPSQTSSNFLKKNGSSYPQSRTERIEKRECISCGRNISHQKKGSLFCSERDRGKAAKACRNVDSNRRRTLRRRIMKAQNLNAWLLIQYRENGQPYAETLHASEVSTGGAWLNLVESVEVLEQEPAQVLEGQAARALLERLSLANARQVVEVYQSRSSEPQ